MERPWVARRPWMQLGRCFGLGCLSVLVGCTAGFDDERIEEQEEEVVWNSGLVDYHLLTTPERLFANSTAAVMPTADITACNTSFCTLRTVSGRMCAGERFATQKALPSAGTAFMVGPRHFATAAHNFDAAALGSCSSASVVFRWRKDSSATAANPNILLEHIYACSQIVADGREEGQDWLVFTVDRDVTSTSATPRGPLKLSAGPATVGAQISLPQHFAGLPMKWNEGAIESLPHPDPAAQNPFLRAKVDITGGSSGCPWVHEATSTVLGILSRGPTEQQSPCVLEKKCLNPPCTSITDQPAGTPAWFVAKGPSEFANLTNWVKPAGVPLAGDFDGDGRSDVLWFGSGAAADVAWWGDGAGNFVTTAVTIATTNVPVVGDFDGDKRTDVFWYGSGTASDFVWWGNTGRTFTQTSQTVSGTGLKPVAGDFDADGRDDVFWYGPGVAADSVWYGNGSARTFTAATQTVSGSSFTPLAGDFDGDGRDDVFWFAPGTTADSIWWAGTGRTFTTASITASFTGVTPVVGDFDGDSQSDILWQVATSTTATLWPGRVNRSFASKAVAIVAAAQGVSRDYNNDDLDDLFLPGSTALVMRAKGWGG